MKLLWVLFLALMWACTGGSMGAQQAADFYVSANGNDGNDGSSLRPWATIQHAALAVGPGATIHVAGGTYFGAIRTTVSGTATARIRFVSEPQGKARIVSNGAEAAWRNDGDYVTIEGFDVSGDGAVGIQNLASYDRIVGNLVHDIPAAGCTGNGGAGIYIGNYSAHDSDTIGNVVHDVGNVDTKCFTVHGIYHTNRGGHIWNNITYRNQGWGIHLWHAARDVVVANNLVYRNGAGGILIGAGDLPGNVFSEGVEVVNNIIVDNVSRWTYGYAIREAGRTGANVYLNNLIHGNSAYLQLATGRISGTVDADPQFVNYQPDGSGDYHLKPSSPAIDAGVSSPAPQDDIEGKPRPSGRGWDIGPYEWVPAMQNQSH